MDSVVTYASESLRILPPRGQSKLVLVLEAYLDESGIDGRPHVICAGYLASNRTWTGVIRRWESVRHEFKAPVFHAKRFFHPEAFKNEYPDWDERKRNQYLDALIAVAKNPRLAKIDQAIEFDTFKKLPESYRRWLTGGKRSPVSFKWKLSGAQSKPFFFCFMHCLNLVDQASNAPLIANVYMDEQNQYEAHAVNLFARYKERIPENRLGSITYGNRTQFPALQIADLLAYLWHCQLNREPSRFEVQAMWMLMREKKESVNVWRDDGISEYIDSLLYRGIDRWTTEDIERAQRYLEGLSDED